MNLSWHVQRLSRMTPAEVVRRARDEVIKQLWRRRQVRRSAVDPILVPSKAPFSATTLPQSDRLQVPARARNTLITAADHLLDGRWRVFQVMRTDMAPAPDWFLDPRTGRRTPQDVYAFHCNHRNETEVGNIKYVWELSRHHHLTVLAAAFYLTADDRYARCVETHLNSWWDENPFLSGVHWISGIEVGMRLISWVWIRRLLDGWSGVGQLFDEKRVFLQQLHHHQRFLAKLPSHGSSANNHLLAEAAGQFVASCSYPCFRESDAWRKRAARDLRREIPRQTFSSGLNRELATEYHGFVLEICLLAALEGESAGISLGAEVWETIRRMVDALAATLDAQNRPPRQGDQDDGLGLLLDAPESFDRWTSLLATGEKLFGACSWWPVASQTDVRTSLWTCLATPPRLPSLRPTKRPHVFPDAGMVILRDRSGCDDEIWCHVDHGPHGYGSIAAHAHADALSVEVRFGGVDILADPGTYCYHGEPQWRSAFRSTLGHNTLECDGRDQSVSGGPFLWTRHARAKLIYLRGIEDGPCAEWCATHDGYSRLFARVIHRRAIKLERASRRLVIEDSVDCDREQTCRLAFHLGPDVHCVLAGTKATLLWNKDQVRGSALLVLHPTLSWTQHRGRREPPLGWYSASFDKKVPATTLVGTGTIGPGRRLETVLLFDRDEKRHVRKGIKQATAGIF